MATRALPVGLLLLTLVLDAQGSHRTSFYVLVFALAAAAVGALSALGDLVETSDGFARLEAVLSGLAVVFVLVAAAARGQTAAAAESVPQVAVSGTVGALLLLAAALLVRTAVPSLRRAPVR
ncbi:MAG: hypothetical protein WD067_03295 [Gaiellaceae bacterium]